MERTYIYKVYNTSGTYVKTLEPGEVLNEPNFTRYKNGGNSELTIKTSREIDNYGEGTDIDFDYTIKIYVVDDHNTDPELIYTGYIAKFQPWLREKREGTDIFLQPPVTKLANDYYREGNDLRVTDRSADVSDVFEHIIDSYRASASNPLLSYDGSSISSTSTTVTHEFYRELLSQALKLAGNWLPSGWYWRVGPDGKVYVEQETTAAHTFIVGKDVGSLDVRKDFSNIVNKIFFTNNRYEDDPYCIDEVYNDSSSQSSYGVLSYAKSDERYKHQNAADAWAANFLAKHKDPKRIIHFTVRQNYDIYSILPGQACDIKNLDIDQTVVVDDMVIEEVSFDRGRATITLSQGWENINRQVFEPSPDIDSRITALERGNSETRISTVGLIIDGGGVDIETGDYGPLPIGFYGRIIGARLLAKDDTGDIEVEVWKEAHGGAPPTSDDKISASAPLTFSSDNKYEDDTLTGWNTYLRPGDWLIFNVNSCTDITHVTAALDVVKVEGYLEVEEDRDFELHGEVDTSSEAGFELTGEIDSDDEIGFELGGAS